MSLEELRHRITSSVNNIHDEVDLRELEIVILRQRQSHLRKIQEALDFKNNELLRLSISKADTSTVKAILKGSLEKREEMDHDGDQTTPQDQSDIEFLESTLKGRGINL